MAVIQTTLQLSLTQNCNYSRILLKKCAPAHLGNSCYDKGQASNYKEIIKTSPMLVKFIFNRFSPIIKWYSIMIICRRYTRTLTFNIIAKFFIHTGTFPLRKIQDLITIEIFPTHFCRLKRTVIFVLGKKCFFLWRR